MTGSPCRYSILAKSKIASYRSVAVSEPSVQPPIRASAMVHRIIDFSWALMVTSQLEGIRESMKRIFLLYMRLVTVAGIVLMGSMLEAQVANNTALVGTV